MKTLLLGAVAVVALFGRAEAQGLPPLGPGWSQQSAAYLSGPPIVREPNLRVTWQGITQWGRTLYFASDDGRQGVMWQVNPASPWLYKVSDGESGTIPAEDIAPQQTFAPAPAYRAPPPQTYAASYPAAPAPSYQPPQQWYASGPAYQAPAPEARQAAAAITMFGMAFCAVSGRC